MTSMNDQLSARSVYGTPTRCHGTPPARCGLVVRDILVILAIFVVSLLSVDVFAEPNAAAATAGATAQKRSVGRLIVASGDAHDRELVVLDATSGRRVGSLGAGSNAIADGDDHWLVASKDHVYRVDAENRRVSLATHPRLSGAGSMAIVGDVLFVVSQDNSRLFAFHHLTGEFIREIFLPGRRDDIASPGVVVASGREALLISVHQRPKQPAYSAILKLAVDGMDIGKPQRMVDLTAGVAASPVQLITGMVFDDHSRLLVVDGRDLNIWTFAGRSLEKQTRTVRGDYAQMANPAGIALNANHRELFIASVLRNHVLRFDVATGELKATLATDEKLIHPRVVLYSHRLPVLTAG